MCDDWTQIEGLFWLGFYGVLFYLGYSVGKWRMR